MDGKRIPSVLDLKFAKSANALGRALQRADDERRASNNANTVGPPTTTVSRESQHLSNASGRAFQRADDERRASNNPNTVGPPTTTVSREYQNVRVAASPNPSTSRTPSVATVNKNSTRAVSPASSTTSAISVFNLDDTGRNPRYVRGSGGSGGSSRGGPVPHSRAMGTHVCETDYLDHLQEMHEVALEAKKQRPKEEVWD